MDQYTDRTLEYMPEAPSAPDALSGSVFDEGSSSNFVHRTRANIIQTAGVDPWREIDGILSRVVCDRVSISELNGCDLQTPATATKAGSIQPKPNWIKLEFFQNGAHSSESPILVPMSSCFGNRISLGHKEDGDPPTVSDRLISSLNEHQAIKPDDTDCWVVLEMVPRPAFAEGNVSHEGLTYYSGSVRVTTVLKDKCIQMFRDPQKTRLQARRNLTSMLSVQNEGLRKLSNGKSLYCFRIVLGSPKKDKTESQQAESYPGWMITTKKCGNVQYTTLSSTFGVCSDAERGQWMTKIVQSLTEVFPKVCLDELTIAGWCYAKTSVASWWSGAWITLSKRSLYIYSEEKQQLDLIDLRKARCIEEIRSDDSIGYLHVEDGPMLFIDCPPQNALYCIMGTVEETKNWKALIQESAHKNGEDFESQQLTENDIPILIDKCINFVFTHGSRSEGIYRKSGSSTKIKQILQAFKKNAFAVQLLRSEYDEHDVAGALRRFIRMSPSTLFGNYSVSFISLTSLPSDAVKIVSFRELLTRLRPFEYNTLKKIIGHLRFIATQKEFNKMDEYNLATIWSSTLLNNSELKDSSEVNQYQEDGVKLVNDMIKHYVDLFPISAEEVAKEKLMSQVLQNMYLVDNKLTSLVKAPAGLQCWITINCNEASNVQSNKEDKLQVSVLVSPNMIACDMCKQLSSKTNLPWNDLTLFEVIADGSLMRPIHYTEKVLPVVQRWSKWDEEDRKTNYLMIQPVSGIVSDINRYIQKAPALNPTTELFFADPQTKVLRQYKLQLIGREIVVLKEVSKSKAEYQEVIKIDVGSVFVYIGREAKRGKQGLRWSLTLVQDAFWKRTRESPFMGYFFGGVDYGDQLMWYSSIWYSLYNEDILPRQDKNGVPSHY